MTRNYTRKRAIDAYNVAVLENPNYTPIKLFNTLEEMFFPGAEVSYELMCSLLDLDRCSLSRILNKHQVLSPRIALTIMDVTGWTREQFNSYSGMVPYVGRCTKEHAQELLRRESEVEKPLRSAKRAAEWQRHKHPLAWKDTDQGSVGLAQRAPSMESSDRD